MLIVHFRCYYSTIAVHLPGALYLMHCLITALLELVQVIADVDDIVNALCEPDTFTPPKKVRLHS